MYLFGTRVIYIAPSLSSTFTILYIRPSGRTICRERVYESLSSIVIEFHDGDGRPASYSTKIESAATSSLTKKSTDREEFHGRVYLRSRGCFFPPVKFALNYDGESARAALIAYFRVDRYL